jgi:hypothetical protein
MKTAKKVASKTTRSTRTEKAPELTIELTESEFERLIYDPIFAIDSFVDLLDRDDPRLKAPIRILSSVFSDIGRHFVMDDCVMHRQENENMDGKTLTPADVEAFRHKLTPMFELNDLIRYDTSDDALCFLGRTLCIWCGFFDWAARELEAKLAEARNEHAA